MFGFSQRSNLEIEHVEFCARLLNLHFRSFDLLRQGCNFSFATGDLSLEFLGLLLGLLKLKHRLPLFLRLHFHPEFLVLLRLGSVLRESIALVNQFTFHNPIAIFAVLYGVEFFPGLDNFAIERRHPSQFINNLTPFTGIHRNDPCHIPLQHHVVAFRVDAQTVQLLMQISQGAGFAINRVGRSVSALLSHPELSSDIPFIVFNDDFLSHIAVDIHFLQQFQIIGQIKRHRDTRFHRAPSSSLGLIHQIWQPFRSHSLRSRQPQAKQNSIQKVRLSGPIGT